MKKYAFFTTLLTIIFAISLSAQPKMEYDGLKNNTYNWGDVKSEQSPLKTKIFIKNIGTEDLIIYKVKPSCGCTTAPLDKDTVKPNDKATLDVSLKIENLQGDFSKNINVSTNDPNNQTSKITLKGFVTKALIVNPRNLSFNDLIMGQPSVTKAKIKNTTDENITLKEIKTDPPELTVNLKDETVIPPKGEIVLEATFTPKDSAGKFGGKIVMKTTNADMPKLDIQVYGRSKTASAPMNLKPGEKANINPQNMKMRERNPNKKGDADRPKPELRIKK